MRGVAHNKRNEPSAFINPTSNHSSDLNRRPQRWPAQAFTHASLLRGSAAKTPLFIIT